MEQHEAMFVAQNNLCDICRRPETAKDRRTPSGLKRLSVDHDHTTGAIRALLCTNCNHGIGKFRDDPKLLEAAAAYLRRFS